MFDLEQQIRSWRTSIRDAIGNRPELLDELESHLRDDFERLFSAGQSAQEAWENASLQLGDPFFTRPGPVPPKSKSFG